LGCHVSSNHYHSHIPDMRSLKDSLWTSRFEVIGIEMNEAKQLTLMVYLCLS